MVHTWQQVNKRYTSLLESTSSRHRASLLSGVCRADLLESTPSRHASLEPEHTLSSLHSPITEHPSRREYFLESAYSGIGHLWRSWSLDSGALERDVMTFPSKVSNFLGIARTMGPLYTIAVQF